MKPTNKLFPGRRQFLSSLTRLAAGSLAMGLPSISLAENAQKTFTVQQVIDIILKEIPGAPFPRTVDLLRTGSPDQEVTGIVTTTFPTIEVIRQAAGVGANMIIAHETSFYNHQDETDWLQEDEVFLHKIELINRHQIAIWRFHDYWHLARPDGIMMGMAQRLGWELDTGHLSARAATEAVAMTAGMGWDTEVAGQFPPVATIS
jgi:putative NIF3 family GTP cyclohydrolase 1 type 2